MIRANRSCVIVHNGIPVSVIEGDAYEDDDPFVRDFAWLFGDQPVEEATASPGAKRKR